MTAPLSDRPATGAPPVRTARAAGWIACTACGAVWAPGPPTCGRCGAALRSRPAHGLSPVWAWLIAGMLLYIPANLWPMLITRTLGREQASTIFGGVVDLVDHGSYGVALVVFTASIVIPVAKFIVIGWLAFVVTHGSRPPARLATHCYEAVEFIGRWSMIDIFVVAILAALVRLGFVASIAPGPAAACFALSVAATMLAARAFDPRLVWDRIGDARG